MTGRSIGLRPVLGLLLGAIWAFSVWAERRHGWVLPGFRLVAHLFYEQSALAALREPSQVALVRWHGSLWIGLISLRWLLWPVLKPHGRTLWTILIVGYAIRASIWIIGSNLPLVPGDSSHYVEVASSILNGEGPVKHYVESFFEDYPRIREGKGVLDDWATPLYAYLLAGAYRLTGVVPGDSIEATFAVSKGLSFLINLVTLPVLYGFARRRFGSRVALGAVAVLSVLPVHAIYAGMELRESLVTLTSLLAVWLLSESWNSEGKSAWAFAIAAGFATGLAILSRNTAMALAAAIGLSGLISQGRRGFLRMSVWGVVTVAVILPWAWVTYLEYREPFHTYTKYFQYNFSWAVHHYDKGLTQPGQFYTSQNASAIIRVKLKSILIISLYSTMMLGLPLIFGFVRRLTTAPKDDRARSIDRMVALIAVAFVGGTLVNVADVTQVEQIGRYYVPLFVLMLPTAVAGVLRWLDERTSPQARPVLASVLVALLWSNPTWAYDFNWLGRTYQLHWPALIEAGEYVRAHPDEVPPSSRIMTWFPWEFRLASRRTTILMNRSLYPPHLRRTIDQYGVTHVLWGSFEPPPEIDPELWGPSLTRIRTILSLDPSREIYATPPPASPIGTYPVTLYRLSGPRP